MKTIFYLFIFSYTIPAIGQYQSMFGEGETYWKCRTMELSGNIADSTVYVFDTIISDIQYKKVLHYYFTGNPFSTPSILYFKEDNTKGKVSFRTQNDTTHYLVYNLSLSVGDYYHGRTIDSIYTEFNLKHIRFVDTVANSGGEQFVMIEGVGTNEGLLWDADQLSGLYPYLLCQHKDEELNFINDHPVHGGLCSPSTVDVDEYNLSSSIKLFPNPAKDYVHIESSYSVDYWSLLNNQGIEVGNSKTQSQKDLTINLKGQRSGLYFVKIKLGQEIVVKKLLVQ